MERPRGFTGEDSGEEGALSPAERKFERARRTLGLPLGPLTAAALYLIPMPALSPEAHTLAAVLGWVVLWWVTEPVPIPVTALLGAALCVLGGVAPAKQVLAPFAEPTIYLFLGSFLLAEAMSVHGLDRRVACQILSLRWVGSGLGRVLFTFGAITAFLSMWISNTATAAMMYPIGLGIVSACGAGRAGGSRRDSPLSTGMMLMVAYAASVGGIGTPVGSPPNLIGMAMIEKFAGVKIHFFQWMLIAVPLLAVMFLALFALLTLLHRPVAASAEGGRRYVRAQMAELGPWSRGEINALLAFSVAVVLWVVPGFLALVWGPDSVPAKAYNGRVPEAVAALLAASLLFVLPLDWGKREFTLSWKQAVRIDWGTLLLFGGGMSLGNLMFETKLARAVGEGILGLSGASSTWGITLAAIFTAILVSEATSNTASANMVVPVMISLALAAGVDPVPPALGATLGASWGFMLPVSTPPNAIVYGSGMVPITAMVKAGLIFDIAGGLLLWGGLRLLLPLAGLA